MKTDAEWKKYERERETQREAEREAAKKKWAARVAEIEAGISAALTALGVKHRHDSYWKIGAASPVHVSIEYVAVADKLVSRFSDKSTAERWGGASRVKVDGYGGTMFHESKGAAKKINSARESDFDYPAIAEHLKARYESSIRSAVINEKKADAKVRGTAAMRRLGGRKVFGDADREIWPDSDCRVTDDIDISYDFNPPSFDLTFTIKVTARSEERAKTILDFLKSLPKEEKAAS